jgi:hypothetical protein
MVAAYFIKPFQVHLISGDLIISDDSMKPASSATEPLKEYFFFGGKESHAKPVH